VPRQIGSTSARKALIVFMKYPEAGRVKTRLSIEIGDEEALHVYQKLTRRTLGIASDFKQAHGKTDLFLFYDPPDAKIPLQKQYPGPWEFVPQADGHLGDRMRAAFAYVFELGYGQAVLVGTDIADIADGDLREAFQALGFNQAVLGPALDGGFYLIGLSSMFARIFEFSSWSTPSVFERTAACFDAAHVKVASIQRRKDVDQIEDLQWLNENAMFQDQISIIVPFLSKTKKIAFLIDTLEAQLWPGDDILLVKGGPPSERAPLHISAHTTLFFAPRGRGNQLNLGARMARNNLFWFLHADTAPPANFGYHVRKISQAPEAMLGCFELQFKPTNVYLDLISKWANMRTKYFKLPYGDQGFFCSRQTFEELGGFKKQFLMEDLDFVRKCRTLGKLLIVPQRIGSSSRRYSSKGLLRASVLNHWTVLLYFLGVDDRKLYSRYYDGI
jgi:hypothetical protein